MVVPVIPVLVVVELVFGFEPQLVMVDLPVDGPVHLPVHGGLVGRRPRSTPAVDPVPPAPRDRSLRHARPPPAAVLPRSGRSCAPTSPPVTRALAPLQYPL